MREEKFLVSFVYSDIPHTRQISGIDSKNSFIDLLKKKPEVTYIKCEKLYPFSTAKNQHNFMLVSNVCFNRMHDMDFDDVPYDEKEYDRLYDLKEKADRCFEYELPVAWLTYNELAEAKEISTMAVEHRVNTCIENNRLDLVKYC